MNRTVPPGYLELLPVWNRLAQKLQTLYVVLGVISTVCSLSAATFTTELGNIGVKSCSFSAALALGLIGAFKLGSKANGARNAWRLLNAAVLAYQGDDNYTIQELHKQYLAGESLLGDIDYVAPSAKPQNPG
ncbi:MAG: hypothetical protein AB7G68_11035 [Nitrospiraceae bacterium]